MRKDVAQFIYYCHTSSCAKPSHNKPPSLLHSLKISSDTWEEVSMDIVSGLPESKSGNNSVLVIVN